METMDILVKIPTRERPLKFIDLLADYHITADSYFDMICSIDEDDETMKDLVFTSGITYFEGKRTTKIDACNRDIPKDGWDIIILASDDMKPKVKGWDTRIKKDMAENFSDLNGCLWYFDGRQPRIATMVIMGKKYYDRFGYLYHPSYKSLWCDNEYTDVAMKAGEMYKSDDCLFEHYHPAWHPEGVHDNLYAYNDKFWDEDKANYYRRKELNFPK